MNKIDTLKKKYDKLNIQRGLHLTARRAYDKAKRDFEATLKWVVHGDE